MELKGLSKYDSEINKTVFKEFEGESDRATAIVAGAYLDDLLGRLLEKYIINNKTSFSELIDPNNPFAPLGAFASRINMSYGLGLIPNNIKNGLIKIKKIRNEFAHNINLNFDSKEVTKICNSLKESLKIDENDSSRLIFEYAVAYVSGAISVMLAIVEENNISGNFKDIFKFHKL